MGKALAAGYRKWTMQSRAVASDTDLSRLTIGIHCPVALAVSA
jgi:hypothetical protein